MAKNTTAPKEGETTAKKKRAPKAEVTSASAVAPVAPKAKAKKAKAKSKVKSYGIDDMVNAIWADIQADENAPKSAKEALTKVALKSVLQREQDLIVGAVSEGDKVAYIGFGTYEQRERAARKGRNPQTGEEIDIPAAVVPAFKPGKGFKGAVRG